MRQVNQAGINLIKSFEGIPDGDPSTVNLDAYVDPVGILTIGYGHAITYKGSFLTTKLPDAKRIARELYPKGITREEAESLLKSDITKRSPLVEEMVKVPISDNQFAALVSFAFNLGTNALKTSTLLKKLNAGDIMGASNEFSKWVNSGGKRLSGLVRRRAAEKALFCS